MGQFVDLKRLGVRQVSSSHVLSGRTEEHWTGVQTEGATQGQAGKGNGGAEPFGVEAAREHGHHFHPLITALTH